MLLLHSKPLFAESLASDIQQDEREVLHALHEGTEVVELRSHTKVSTTRIKISQYVLLPCLL
jgi:hypothetical protein